MLHTQNFQEFKSNIWGRFKTWPEPSAVPLWEPQNSQIFIYYSFIQSLGWRVGKITFLSLSTVLHGMPVLFLAFSHFLFFSQKGVWINLKQISEVTLSFFQNNRSIKIRKVSALPIVFNALWRAGVFTVDQCLLFLLFTSLLKLSSLSWIDRIFWVKRACKHRLELKAFAVLSSCFTLWRKSVTHISALWNSNLKESVATWTVLDILYWRTKGRNGFLRPYFSSAATSSNFSSFDIFSWGFFLCIVLYTVFGRWWGVSNGRLGASH